MGQGTGAGLGEVCVCVGGGGGVLLIEDYSEEMGEEVRPSERRKEESEDMGQNPCSC